MIAEQPEAITSVTSGSEHAGVRRELRRLGASGTPPGAGFKLMCVVLGACDAYVLSKHSTYKWDTCAPHAILRAAGGSVSAFHPRPASGTAPAAGAEVWPVRYHAMDAGTKQWRNSTGLVVRGVRLCDNGDGAGGAELAQALEQAIDRGVQRGNGDQ